MKKFLVAFLVCVMCISLCALCACEEPIDPTTQSLEITNVAELTSKWNVGEADREVEVALSDGLQGKKLEVKAEPQGIISVDGTTLHAEKAGNATVTATVVLDEEHVFSDSVEIEVSYNYSLQITNKADLTKAFRIGEEREVQVTVPEALQSLPVTLTSSQPTAVQVQGNKITAATKGTATVTASVKLDEEHVFSDKFDVTVWGEFGLELTNTNATVGKNNRSIEIEYELVEAGDYTDSDVTITSSDTEVATIEGKTVVTHDKCGTTTITVKCGDVSKQFDVTVEVQAELEIAAFDENAVYFIGEGEGEGCVLPAIVKAINSLEQDVSEEVEITSPDGLKISSNVATADRVGKFTVTYTLHDVEGKEDKTVTIHISFVEELFASTGAHAGNDKAEDPLDEVTPVYGLTGEEDYTQTTTFASNALLFGKLDSTGSKQYYAEATFDVGAMFVGGVETNATLAIGHFTTENEKQTLLVAINASKGTLVTTNITFNVSDSIPKASDISDGTVQGTYAYPFTARHIARKDGDTGAIVSGQDGTNLVTIAVLRDGDYFYTFINGQYLSCVTSQALRDADTVPAIVGKWFNKAQITVTDIVYVKEANKLQEKMVELLGEHKEKMIVPFADSNNSATDSHSESFGDNVKIETNIENKGLAFTYTNGVGDKSNDKNGSAVSPYLYFDGNFTFSWDYKMTNIKELADQSGDTQPYKSILELKDSTIGYEILQLGFANKTSGDSPNKQVGTTYRPELNVMGYGKSDSNYKNWGQPSDNDAGVTGIDKLNLNTNLRFSVTRILLEDKAVYVMTATVLDDSGVPTEKTYTRIITWFGDAPHDGNAYDAVKGDGTPAEKRGYDIAQHRWDYSVIPYWRNSGVSGEFTNISWSLLANDVTAESVAQGENTKDVTVSTSDTTYPETDGQSTTMTKFTLKLDNANRGDIVCKPNTQIEAGEYIVRIFAIGDTKKKPVISETLIYEQRVTLTAADYLKLGNLVLGHGTYEVRLIKVPAAA